MVLVLLWQVAHSGPTDDYRFTCNITTNIEWALQRNQMFQWHQSDTRRYLRDTQCLGLQFYLDTINLESLGSDVGILKEILWPMSTDDNPERDF